MISLDQRSRSAMDGLDVITPEAVAATE